MALFGSSRGKKEKAAAGPVGPATLGDGSVVEIAQSVDCLGDSCPRPQLMTKKAISQVAVGEVIQVLVDNPSSVEALPPMCDELNATHLDTVKDARCWRVYIRKD